MTEDRQHPPVQHSDPKRSSKHERQAMDELDVQSLPLDTLLGSRFRLETVAGRGGMGVVYRARDEQTQATVALKVLVASDPISIDRFRREAELLAQLRHPAIVRHVAHGQTAEGHAWLAMEWLDGEDLSGRLEREGLEVAESLGLAERLADALGEAHGHGIVHRDIKPSNVLLPGGRWQDAKLLDFGIARPLVRRTALTGTGTFLGTPGYMAPEQLDDQMAIDARADVFSLGAVLFECLTGKPAFSGETIMAVLARLLLEDAPRVDEVRSDVPVAIADLVARMLSRNRDDRPLDGQAVRQALAALGRHTGAPPAAQPMRPSLTGSEQRLLSVVVGLPDAPDAAADTLRSSASLALFASIRDAMTPFGARVDDVGGAILASLTSAHNPSDQAARAAQCALAMRALVPRMSMAIVTGRDESSGRLPVGPIVDRAANVLSRVRTIEAEGESPQRPTIWLDDVTRALLDVRFDVLETEGGAELLGEREFGEASRSLLGKATPCVGRARELSMLEALVDESFAEDVAHIVLVTGPPGIGKSRVRYEIVRRLRQRFPTSALWVGRADQVRAGSAYFLLGSMLRYAASIDGNEPAQRRIEKLTALASVVPESDRLRVAAFLGEIAGEPFDENALPILHTARRDGAVMAEEVRWAFEAFMDATSAAQPVCLVLEDLHWADPPSVRMLDRTLGALRDRPYCLIAFARPEINDVFPRLFADRLLDRMALGELGKRAAERLVEHVLGLSVDAETVAKIVERAAGNAFILEEMIRAIAERRNETLPETVLGMIESRLASLTADERRALRAASIFGATFWTSGVAALAFADRPMQDVSIMLDKLAEREVLRACTGSRFQGENAYSFRHDLLRAGAHAMLTDDDRTLGHALAAEWLERMGETDSVVLADHWEKTGNAARAAKHLTRAAEQALRADEIATAIQRCGRGLALGPSNDLANELHLVAAEAFAFSVDLDASKKHLDACLAVAEPGTRAHTFALAGALTNAILRGDPASLREAIPTLLAADPVPEVAGALAWTLSFGTDSMCYIGQMELADQFIARLRQLTERFPQNDVVAAWYEEGLAARAFVVDDNPGDAAIRHARAAALLEQSGQLQYACYARGRHLMSLAMLGAYEQTEAFLSTMKPTSITSSLSEALFAIARTLVFIGRGATNEAIAITDDFVSNTNRDPATRASFRLFLTYALLVREDYARAAREFEMFRQQRLGFKGEDAVIASFEAAITLGRGDPSAAIEWASKAIALRDSPVPYGSFIGLAYLALAQGHLALGHHDAVRASLVPARKWVLARVAKVEDIRMRQTFLENIREHATILSMADEWGV